MEEPPEPSNPVPGSLYKVIAGSFQSRENADERVAFLEAKGIDAFVKPTTIAGKNWYRVQAGAYSNRENTEKQYILKFADIWAGFADKMKNSLIYSLKPLITVLKKGS
ncbi:SPOR domain-containing protein [Bacillus salipaludis]|uniref:SPOR domain-containing protein n=1 Tax=Bacillus salipaludis TaxID=2547811 RepID=A0ABW8REV1_9BACI